MRRLLQWLLDERCSNILSFLDWYEISGPIAQAWMLPLFREHPELVNWTTLCRSYKSWMRQLVADNAHRVDWGLVQSHCFRAGLRSLPLLRDHPEHLPWQLLCQDPVKWMLPLFEENVDKLDWEAFLLSMKHYQGDNWRQHFVVANAGRIGMQLLCANPHEWMMPLFRADIDGIAWTKLSANPRSWMAPLFRDHPDRVNWTMLCRHARRDTLDLMMEFADLLDWQVVNKNLRNWMSPLLERNEEHVD